jgi:WD40 repeat protein
VPGYEIVRELGRGGMGVVYQARHVKLNRPVALKMILAGSHAGATELARFQTEAEAIARLRHPNIVQVYEVGDHEGKPYFSLEFCESGSLEKKLGGTPLPPKEAAYLVETLARAMQAAHEQKVIHRDLKPANVLLSEDGTPKITDFGLAKKLDEAGQTASGAVMGTPSYMAPEQAGGKSAEVGPLADVYALGAILYECLTGRPPFKAATGLDTILQVVSEEPVSPRQLNANVPRDLETVCLKCLDKNPGRRYGSASALADDVRRWRAGEPIRARRVGPLERAAKWVARNRLAAALLTSLALTLVGGVVVSVAFAIDAARQAEQARTNEARATQNEATAKKNESDALAAREAAEAAEKAEAEQRQKTLDALNIAQTNLSLDQIVLAKQHWSGGNLEEARRLLSACPAEFRHWEWWYLNKLCAASLLDEPVHKGPVTSFRVSRDGRHLLTATEFTPEPGVKVWECGQRPALRLLCHIRHPAMSAALGPSADLVADGSLNGEVRLWHVATGQEARLLGKLHGRVTSVDFSADGLLVAAGSRVGSAFADPGELAVWKAATGEEVFRLKGVGCLVRFNPDGTRLVADAGTELRLWDTATWKVVRSLGRGLDSLDVRPSLDFSPDGKLLAATGLKAVGSKVGHFVRVIEAGSGREVLRLRMPDSLAGVAISPDGRQLAAGTGPLGTMACLWDLQDGGEIRNFRGQTHPITAIAFRPDGKGLLAAAEDGHLIEWAAEDEQESQTLVRAGDHLNLASFDAAATRAAVFSLVRGTRIQIWDLEKRSLAKTLDGHREFITDCTFSCDGNYLASASFDRTVRVWDVVAGKPVYVYTGHGSRVWQAAISPDGEWVASADEKEPLARVWNARTGTERCVLREHNSPVKSLAFSNDGELIASVSDVTLKIWKAASGEEVASVRLPSREVRSLTFSGDRKLLAVATWGWLTCVSVESGRVAYAKPLKEQSEHASLAFTADGRLIASSGRAVTVWDAKTGQEVLTLGGADQPLLKIAASADGQRLVACQKDGWIKIWQGGP